MQLAEKILSKPRTVGKTKGHGTVGCILPIGIIQTQLATGLLRQNPWTLLIMRTLKSQTAQEVMIPQIQEGHTSDEQDQQSRNDERVRGALPSPHNRSRQMTPRGTDDDDACKARNYSEPRTKKSHSQSYQEDQIIRERSRRREDNE